MLRKSQFVLLIILQAPYVDALTAWAALQPASERQTGACLWRSADFSNDYSMCSILPSEYPDTKIWPP